MNHTIKTLAADVRKVMLDRIAEASNADLLAIAGSLFADDEPPAVAAQPANSRFTLYDIHGSVVPSGGVAVYDAEMNLTWTRKPLECGAVSHKDAVTACANYRLFGKDDWHLQTVKERVSINDYTKFGPALYSEFEAGDASYEWTSTVDAESPSACAWIVTLHNGDVYRFVQASRGGARAVRAGESHDAVSLRSLHSAWARARRGKKPSPDQLTFDAYWIDGLIDLQRQLVARTWAPGKPTCFVATAPKAREIHAPPFGNRVVHHWLVPQLEAIYEPKFIFDSYSNRKGKGTHAAVERLTDFMRQVHSGQGGGWYLQLDIRNFFNSIHRPTLYAMLKRRIQSLPPVVQYAAHALLRRSPVAGGVNFVGSAAERAQVPAYKRLENAAPGCGLAIGNLSSQFFANVYLDALDQFVKHELKAQRYLRYVDDFVLVHRDREQLQAWQAQIETFLRDRLRLELKADIKLKPLSAGCDFLGYVIYPSHRTVRRRVVGHLREKLSAWSRIHVRRGEVLAPPRAQERLRSVIASYAGHFKHASSFKARRSIGRAFPWLKPFLSKGQQ